MRILLTIIAAVALAAAAAVALFPERTGSVLPAFVAERVGLGGRADDGGAPAGGGDGPAEPAGGGAGGGGGARPVPVDLATVGTGTAVERFETSGEVRAAEDVVLTSEVAGEVEEIFVEDGMRLSEGAPVIRFDARSEREALEAARARLAEAEADLDRARQLYERDVAAEAQVETARAAAEAAKADVEAAANALEDRTVRAPFAGEIGFVEVSPGAFLSPGDAITSLETVDDLRVRFSLPLAVARAAERREAVTVAAGGERFTADVVTVSPLADPRSRTRAFEARLPEASDLGPGAFVTVSVITGERADALFVPRKAVERRGFESFVFRAVEADGGLVARRTLVETGAFDGNRVEIREGLGEGDRIVASGIQKVRDGAPIVPANRMAHGGGDGGAEDDAPRNGAAGADGADDGAEAPR